MVLVRNFIWDLNEIYKFNFEMNYSEIQGSKQNQSPQKQKPTEPPILQDSRRSEYQILNSLEITQSRMTDLNHAQIVQQTSANNPSQQVKMRQKCGSCEIWQKWALESQYSILIMQKKLIEREKALQQKMKMMNQKLQEQNRIIKIKEQECQKLRIQNREIKIKYKVCKEEINPIVLQRAAIEINKPSLTAIRERNGQQIQTQQENTYEAQHNTYSGKGKNDAGRNDYHQQNQTIKKEDHINKFQTTQQKTQYLTALRSKEFKKKLNYGVDESKSYDDYKEQQGVLIKSVSSINSNTAIQNRIRNVNMKEDYENTHTQTTVTNNNYRKVERNQYESQNIMKLQEREHCTTNINSNNIGKQTKQDIQNSQNYEKVNELYGENIKESKLSQLSEEVSSYYPYRMEQTSRQENSIKLTNSHFAKSSKSRTQNEYQHEGMKEDVKGQDVSLVLAQNSNCESKISKTLPVPKGSIQTEVEKSHSKVLRTNEAKDIQEQFSGQQRYDIVNNQSELSQEKESAEPKAESDKQIKLGTIRPNQKSIRNENETINNNSSNEIAKNTDTLQKQDKIEDIAGERQIRSQVQVQKPQKNKNGKSHSYNYDASYYIQKNEERKNKLGINYPSVNNESYVTSRDPTLYRCSSNNIFSEMKESEKEKSMERQRSVKSKPTSRLLQKNLQTIVPKQILTNQIYPNKSLGSQIRRPFTYIPNLGTNSTNTNAYENLCEQDKSINYSSRQGSGKIKQNKTQKYPDCKEIEQSNQKFNEKMNDLQRKMREIENRPGMSKEKYKEYQSYDEKYLIRDNENEKFVDYKNKFTNSNKMEIKSSQQHLKSLSSQQYGKSFNSQITSPENAERRRPFNYRQQFEKQREQLKSLIRKQSPENRQETKGYKTKQVDERIIQYRENGHQKINGTESNRRYGKQQTQLQTTNKRQSEYAREFIDKQLKKYEQKQHNNQQTSFSPQLKTSQTNEAYIQNLLKRTKELQTYDSKNQKQVASVLPTITEENELAFSTFKQIQEGEHLNKRESSLSKEKNKNLSTSSPTNKGEEKKLYDGSLSNEIDKISQLQEQIRKNSSSKQDEIQNFPHHNIQSKIMREEANGKELMDLNGRASYISQISNYDIQESKVDRKVNRLDQSNQETESKKKKSREIIITKFENEQEEPAHSLQESKKSSKSSSSSVKIITIAKQQENQTRTKQIQMNLASPKQFKKKIMNKTTKITIQPMNIVEPQQNTQNILKSGSSNQNLNKSKSHTHFHSLNDMENISFFNDRIKIKSEQKDEQEENNTKGDQIDERSSEESNRKYVNISIKKFNEINKSKFEVDNPLYTAKTKKEDDLPFAQNTLKTIKLKNNPLNVEKNRLYDAGSEESYLQTDMRNRVRIQDETSSGISEQVSRDASLRRNPQLSRQSSQNKDRQLVSQLQKLKFENQNLKSYNVVLQKNLGNRKLIGRY